MADIGGGAVEVDLVPALPMGETGADGAAFSLNGAGED